MSGCARETLEELDEMFDRLWPLPRSLTGDAVRQTIAILGELAPVELIEVPSGTRAFDWLVPKEWRIREAYIVTPSGERILNVAENNLHLVGYSIPFRGTLSRASLDEHLHSLPEQPTAIPYVTSYYTPRWGFCLTHEQRTALPDGEYDVVVDTELFDGSLSIGEAVVPGTTDDEILFSTYICHPSLANDNLSGPLVTAYLCRRLAAQPRVRHTLRFVFLPETVGALAYLTLRAEELCRRMVAGYVLTCVGSGVPLTYKRSRRHDALPDRAALHVLGERADPFVERAFFPDDGSDERQYCSPGFDLPVGSFVRSMYGAYPEYHTSFDDKSLISSPALRDTVDVCKRVVHALELNRTYRSLFPYGEPQLSQRGLYPDFGGLASSDDDVRALMWVLNYADGQHDLLSIASLSGRGLDALADATEKALAAGLVEPA